MPHTLDTLPAIVANAIKIAGARGSALSALDVVLNTKAEVLADKAELMNERRKLFNDGVRWSGFANKSEIEEADKIINFLDGVINELIGVKKNAEKRY